MNDAYQDSLPFGLDSNYNFLLFVFQGLQVYNTPHYLYFHLLNKFLRASLDNLKLSIELIKSSALNHSKHSTIFTFSHWSTAIFYSIQHLMQRFEKFFELIWHIYK